MPSRRHFLLYASAALSAAVLSKHAIAQKAAYPSKPIQIKVGFSAGGPSDTSIRSAGVVLERILGKPVVVENMPGAGGAIAAMNIAKATADGYSLLGTTGTDFLVAPLIMEAARYKSSDFRLLGVTGISDFMLLANNKYGFKSVQDLINYAKNPENAQLSIAHWGLGSASHLVAADFELRSGVKFLGVPYKGVAPTITDMIGGHIDLAFVPLGGGAAVGVIQKGQVTPLGVAATSPNRTFPDVPLISDTKTLEGFVHSLWVGILAPTHTPDAVVNQWVSAMNTWLNSPENKKRMAANASGRVDSMTPEQVAEFLKNEREKVSRLAQSLGFRPQ